MSDNTVVLKKRNTISRLGISPTMYYQKRYDPNESGEISNQPFKGNIFPGVKRNLTPEINNGKEWAFDGDYKDLKRIAENLRLRDKEGNIIIPEEKGWRTNLTCPFFNHEALWTTQFVHNGSRALKYDGGIEEFFARVNKGYKKVKRDGEKQSKFYTQDAVWELYSTKSKAKAKSEDIDKELEAAVALRSLLKKEDQLRAVATIFQTTLDAESASKEELKAELIEVIKDLEPSDRFEGKVPRDYFVEICNKDKEELNIIVTVNKGKKLGGIRRNDLGFTFKGQRLPGVTNELELNQFYLDPENVERLAELQEFIKNRS